MPGGPPRHRYRHRRVHRPAGRPVWEHVLPGEIRRRPLEDLHLKFQPAFILAELCQILFLGATQLCLAAFVIDLGLCQPIPQARLADPQLLRQLSDRFGPLRCASEMRCRRRVSTATTVRDLIVDSGWRGLVLGWFVASMTSAGCAGWVRRPPSPVPRRGIPVRVGQPLQYLERSYRADHRSLKHPRGSDCPSS